MLAVPPSGMSSVDRSRTRVDLPEPFWPRIATHSPRTIVKVTPVSAGQARRRVSRPRRLLRRRNVLARFVTSTAGTSWRTCVPVGMGAARVDMLLLLVKREGNGERETLAPGRRADLASARTGEPFADRLPVHRVREQHGP